MGKSITIQEGNMPRGFSANALRIPLQGGGFSLFVPESGILLGNKAVDKNGIYLAQDDGLFAYSEVNVDIPGYGSVTGKGPDGKKYVVTVDDDGNLVETPIAAGDPVRIAVTTPPYNPYGIYQDGQTITKDGMVVTAYDENDNVWGTVPLSQITLQPQQAVYDRMAGTVVWASDPSILEFPNNNPIIVSEAYGIYDCPAPGSAYGYRFNVLGDEIIYCVYVYHSANNHTVVFLSKAPFQFARAWGDLRNTFIPTNFQNSSYYDDEIAGEYYRFTTGTANEVPPFPISLNTRDRYSTNDFARQIWGDGNPPVGSPQTINVTWTRPGQTELTTTFIIRVGPRYGGD